MKNSNIGFLGGDRGQVLLANLLAEGGRWQVYAMFLEHPELSRLVHTAPDFRDVLWLCGTLVLPDPACQKGLELNAPLWPGGIVDAGQFLGSIGKGVLILAGEMTPELRAAAAAREVAITTLPTGGSWERYRDGVLEALEKARMMPKRPLEV